MKKYFLIILIGLFGFVGILRAQFPGSFSPLWYIEGNDLLPIDSTFGLQVAGIASSSSGILEIRSNGWITPTSTPSVSSFTITGLGKNMLLTSNGSGAITASSTPTAAAYLATSTTASSTLQNFSFTNMQGTSASLSALTVTGTGTSTNLGSTKVTGDFEVTGNGIIDINFSDSGNATIGGTLTASSFIATSTATSTFAGGLYASQLAAPYLQATSTTATSTFAGGLSITGNNLNFGSATRILQNDNNFLTSSSTAAGNLTIGYQAAPSLDAQGGLYSTYIGYQAGNTATSSQYNTAVGYQTLKNIVNSGGTLGDYNTAFGAQTLLTNTTGYYNTAVGAYSMRSNTTGNNNTALGLQSSYSNTTGTVNVALGVDALFDNTSGAGNVAVGYRALYNSTTVSNNAAIGYQSLLANTTGALNVAVGTGALDFSVTGSSNTAIGVNVFNNNSSATNTTAVGYQAANGTAAYNNQGGVYLGYQAGYSAGTGSNYNTLLGYQAGYSLTTGASNIAIGQNVDVPSATGNQQLNIGNLLYGTSLYNGSTVSSVPVNAALFGIGTTTPAAKLSVEQGGATTLGMYLAGYANATSDMFRVSTSTTAATSTAFVIDSNGRVGVGTTTPGQQLSVAGQIYSSNNILTSGIFNSSNTTGTSTLSGGFAIETSGIVYDWQTNNTGIGTTVPSTRFNVSTAASSNIRVNSQLSTGQPSFYAAVTDDASTLDWRFNEAAVSNMPINVWEFRSGGSARDVVFSYFSLHPTLTIRSSQETGGVGVGTTTPAAQLSVNQGSATKLGIYLAGYANATYDMFRISTSTLTATSTAFVIDSNGKVGIATTTPWYEFNVESSGTTTIQIGTKQSITNGSCIQMYQPNGVAVRLYINNSGAVITEVGACR